MHPIPYSSPRPVLERRSPLALSPVPFLSPFDQPNGQPSIVTRRRITYGQCTPARNERPRDIPERSPVPRPPDLFVFQLANDA